MPEGPRLAAWVSQRGSARTAAGFPGGRSDRVAEGLPREADRRLLLVVAASEPAGLAKDDGHRPAALELPALGNDLHAPGLAGAVTRLLGEPDAADRDQAADGLANLRKNEGEGIGGARDR